MKKVSIVIANYNGYKLLKSCLLSLRNQTYSNFTIIVVDNGSTDDSVRLLATDFPEVSCIVNKNNVGFAKANNQAIVVALKDPEVSFVSTLNNDTEVDSKWLAGMVEVMEKDARVGVVASKILQMNNREYFDSAGDFLSKKGTRIYGRGQGERDSGQYQLVEEIFTATAAAALFRREALESVRIKDEFFDGDFVSYVEDIDLCVRIRLLGWKCVYTPKAVVFHVGSATSTAVLSVKKIQLGRRNMILMSIKNFPIYFVIKIVWSYISPFYKLQKYIQRLWNREGVFSNKKLKEVDIRFVQYQRLSIFSKVYIHLVTLWWVLKFLPRMLLKRRYIVGSRRVDRAEINRWFRELCI